MAILSFALTKDEFLSGNKTCTRRFWKARYFEQWQRWYDQDPDRVHIAYDKLPRSGGKPIGAFRLTQRPYLQPLGLMQSCDLQAEGAMCATVTEFCDLVGKTVFDRVAVIWFEKVST